MKARKDLNRMKSIATKLKNPNESIAKFIEPTPSAKMRQRTSTLEAQAIPSGEKKELTSGGEPLSDEQISTLKENIEKQKVGRKAKKNYSVDKEIQEQMANDKDLVQYDDDADSNLVIEEI